MNQVTAVCSVFWEDGQKLYKTHYLASCGCEWQVDMWGNVRRVMVCADDVQRGYPSQDQLDLLDGDWERRDVSGLLRTIDELRERCND